MASISDVTIANMALAAVGHDGTIETLEEDSPEAQQCALWYDYARLQVLEAFDWSFARRRSTLAVSSDAAPSNEWAFRYQYPANCVIIRRVENPAGIDNDPVPFAVELNDAGDTKTVVTNISSPRVVYTGDIEIETLFSPHFVDTLAARLASKIAWALTKNSKAVAGAERMYLTLLRQAPALNASEGQQEAPREAEWTRERA